jgi:ATP-binding cassette, subfamily C, bacterial LapB
VTNRVISLDMHPGRAVASPPADTSPRDRQPISRAMARAQLASVYAGLLGAEVPATDLLDHLKIAGTARLGLEEIGAALSASGLIVRVTRPEPDAETYPALAEMTSGQVILVLSASADGLQIYDPTTADLRAEVPLAEFVRVYTGRMLNARTTFADLQARHSEDSAPRHWFWGEFAHYRRQYLEVAAASLVANMLTAAVALYSLQIYDRVIPHQSVPTLWVLSLGALLAIGMDSILRVARSALMDMTGRRIELDVQARLMQRLLGMKAAPGERRPSTIFAAMRDFGSVREFFTAATIGTLADLPFLVIFLALVGAIAGNLVWVLIFGGLVMVLPGLLFQRRMVALTHATQGANTRAAKLLYEAVFEHETLSTQRGEDKVTRLWAELVTLSAVKSSDQRKLTTLLTTWATSVQQATYILAVMIGTYQVFAGTFTVGTIIAVGMLTSRTLGPLSQLSATLARWSNVKAALQGLESVANARQTQEPGRRYLRRERLTGAYELRQLEFRYDPQSTPTVDVPALSILPGQHVAVLGANGSGKSTLLRLLAGLYDPTAGRVLVDGVDMSQIHPRDLRRGIGYLGQEVRLFSGTLRDNLNMTQLERDDDRLFQALDFAGLGPFVRNHPRGLDLEIRELGEGLSVGQRQSMGWARMWLQDPAVALLDEPTAALDQTLESTLVSRLSGWLQGRTAIIATHRVPILHLTTRTLILQNGRLAVDGPREAVLAHLAKGSGK